MKIILSRKGVDSGNSKISNLVIEDKDKKQFIIIPIPSEQDKFSYKKIHFSQDYDFDVITKEYIKSNDIKLKVKCHIDPNLCNYRKEKVFRGSIGQVGSSQTHLKNEGVSIGDIFIFFGRFTPMLLDKGEMKRIEQDKHIIFGYMQIGEIIYPNLMNFKQRKEYKRKYPWLINHPHWNKRKYKGQDNNCIYIAKEKCDFDNSLCGYGLFNYSDGLILTKSGEPPSHWDLSNETLKEKLTYHSAENIKEDYFQSASRGQEFVFEESEKVKQWAKNLISKYGKGEK